MSEETKALEKVAICDSFEEEMRLMFRCFVDSLSPENANVENARQNFKHGLVKVRKAFEMANEMISE